MPFEKSAGAVIFRKKEGENLFLLLLYSPIRSGPDYWDFPKGHIEKGESDTDALEREIEEETGIKEVRIIPGFKEWIKYYFKVDDRNVFKIVTYYLAETEAERVVISEEHKDYRWMSYGEAMEEIKYRNSREILEKAHSFLNKT